jgi:hypothetical protein
VVSMSFHDGCAATSPGLKGFTSHKIVSPEARRLG